MKKLSGLILFAFLPVFGAGCAVDSTDGATTERGPLGKADNVGSCEADGQPLCGGKGAGSCYCDDACVDYGDCCADVLDVCGGDIGGGPTLCLGDSACEDGETCDHSECLSGCPDGGICPAVCFGECVPGDGGGIGDNCSLFGEQCDDGLVCDFICPFDADPCPNFGINPTGICIEPIDPPPPPPPLVKCNADLPCADGEYCHWDEDEGCGSDGGSGVCTPKPEACIEIFSPVCGCDGQVYGNSCDANANGQSWIPAASGNNGFLCPNPQLPEPGSCVGMCGGASVDHACYCDDQCEGFGDCCDDFADACGA